MFRKNWFVSMFVLAALIVRYAANHTDPNCALVGLEHQSYTALAWQPCARSRAGALWAQPGMTRPTTGNGRGVPL